MSKTKSTSKAVKPTKPEALTKVKDAAVTKPAQSSKSKSKDVAKSVATKEDKKSKKSKKVKEPTPEPESESEESASSDSSESESEEEEKVAPVKTNGAKKAAESSDDDSDSSEEDEAPAADGVLGKAPAVTEADSDSDSSEDSEEEAKPIKATKAAAAAKADSSDEESSDDSDADEKVAAAKDDSDDSSDDSSDEEEVEAKPKSTKRKAEEEAEPAAKKTKTAAEGATPQSANLFVGNLSWNVDEAWLKETFEEHGEISRVQLITDRATGRSKGFGYVEFVNAADAATAHAAKQGFELDSRPLNVDFSNPRPPKPDQADRRKSYGDQVSEPSDTLFLGNLSFDVGQETVTEAFSPHGTIMGIRLPTDRETGEPKGFGYVTFASVDEAKAALEAMQGAYISSRPVRLDYSQPRPQNDAGGRGGFGGRGRGGDRGGRGRGGFGGGRGRGGFDRGGRGGGRGRGGSTNRGGFGDFKGQKVSFD